MKVLVFDDTKAHRISAQVTLKDHELTIVGTYDEAQEALLPKVESQKVKEHMKAELGEPRFWSEMEDSEEKWTIAKNYWARERQITKDWTVYPNFDAVLTDLMVPASKKSLGAGAHLAGQEMPLGTTIALLAIASGIKKVAVVTDIDHHSHPASAALDCFHGVSRGELKILCTSRVDMINIDFKTLEIVDDAFLETPEGKTKYPGSWDCRVGLIKGKNWASVLECLTK